MMMMNLNQNDDDEDNFNSSTLSHHNIKLNNNFNTNQFQFLKLTNNKLENNSPIFSSSFSSESSSQYSSSSSTTPSSSLSLSFLSPHLNSLSLSPSHNLSSLSSPINSTIMEPVSTLVSGNITPSPPSLTFREKMLSGSVAPPPKPIGKIDVEMDQLYFISGQMVTGKVKLLLSQDTISTGISLRWKALEHVVFQQTPIKTKYNNVISLSSERIEQKKVIYKDTELIYSTDDNDTDRITKGNHIYPLSFKLPSHLPSSYCSVNQSERTFSSIVYSLSIFIQNSHSTMKVKKSFVVTEPIIVASSINQIPLYKEKSKSFLVGKGEVKLKVSIPKNVFMAGESIPIKCMVVNSSSKFVDYIKVQLKRLETIKVVKSDSMSTITQKSEKTIKQKYQGVGAHSNHESTLNFDFLKIIQHENIQHQQNQLIQQQYSICNNDSQFNLVRPNSDKKDHHSGNGSSPKTCNNIVTNCLYLGGSGGGGGGSNNNNNNNNNNSQTTTPILNGNNENGIGIHDGQIIKIGCNQHKIIPEKFYQPTTNGTLVECKYKLNVRCIIKRAFNISINLNILIGYLPTKELEVFSTQDYKKQLYDYNNLNAM